MARVFFLEPPRVERLASRVQDVRRRRRGATSSACHSLAASLPGATSAESFFVNGFSNFFAIYQNLIIARIFLTWFPALQRSPILQPLYTVCDPYLNIFRGVIPPVFGLDLSPILALFLLQASSSATVALSAEMPPPKGQRTPAE